MEDGFEQSSSGDYSGRTLGRSSKISEKKPLFSIPFGSPHPTTQKSADVRSHQRIFLFATRPSTAKKYSNRRIVILGYMV